MQIVIALITGVVFGLGLILSGMTNPENIQNFLDIFGNWDPALMFVMVGAILISAIAFWWIKSKHTPILGESIHLPSNKVIDAKLIIGATLFGIGWGLVGFCPGPAIASMINQPQEAGLFVLAMIVGILTFNRFKK